MTNKPLSHTVSQFIGVLALQGAFKEHMTVLERLGCTPVAIRSPHELDNIKGLIIPGGESTVMSRLLNQHHLHSAILDKVKNHHMGIWGTCAGAILLAKQVNDARIQSLGLMDITVTRNAFGRQMESFVSELKAKPFKTAFRGVFIRAPLITQVGQAVEVLATLRNKNIVAVRENQYLVTVFHPELTQDTRWHHYFLNTILTGLPTQNPPLK